MGIWGTHPYDSDDAIDLLGPLDDKCRKRMFAAINCKRPTSRRRHYPAARAAAEIVATLIARVPKLDRGSSRSWTLYGPMPVDLRLLYCAQLVLEQCLQDEAWLAEWRNPKSAKRALRRDLKRVKRLVKKHHVQLAWMFSSERALYMAAGRAKRAGSCSNTRKAFLCRYRRAIKRGDYSLQAAWYLAGEGR